MKELQEVMNTKVAEIIASGEIERQISKRIESVIDSALETQFRSYGPIAKQLEKIFQEKLVIDTENIDFESYNQIMLSAVKQRINGMFAESASSKFMKELDEMLGTPPHEMDIHDLVNQVAEYWRRDRSSYDDWEEEICIELEAECGALRGSYSLKMHIESSG
ncbi:hypothetical protein, partial [Photobacterium sp. OFAV2-7]|uniref:hypothetical protein n=1 Tax=Photobacterium sp. OFAV2-7 TaxID=2917748 RepID=UPI001EF47576